MMTQLNQTANYTQSYSAIAHLVGRESSARHASQQKFSIYNTAVACTRRAASGFRVHVYPTYSFSQACACTFDPGTGSVELAWTCTREQH